MPICILYRAVEVFYSGWFIFVLSRLNTGSNPIEIIKYICYVQYNIRSRSSHNNKCKYIFMRALFCPLVYLMLILIKYATNYFMVVGYY